jgi:hypothetical protein
MTAVLTPPRPLALPTEVARPVVPRPRSELKRAACWFVPTAGLYLVIGALLAFRYESFNGDAQARLANAYYMLYSRDPHLAAVGFVWNPLPSFSMVPLLLLARVWPALSVRAFASNIMSALFMAGAVVQFRATLADCRVRRTTAFVLTVLFAIHPMIAYYGGNGMSEGLFLFTLASACRYLMQYLDNGETVPLVRAGVWLAFAYFTRYEAAAAIGFGAIAVVGVAFHRASGDTRTRARAAIGDATIFGLPPLFAFVSWAVASWVIVGHPFEQFSSDYGTTSQLSLMGNTNATLGFAIKMAVLMAPLAFPVALVALALALRRRDYRVLGPLAVFGGVLLFAVAAFADAKTAGWFRYFITAAPLALLLTGVCFAGSADAVATEEPWARAVQAGVAVGVAGAVGLASMAASASAMANRNIGREEHLHLARVIRGEQPSDRTDAGLFPDSLSMARYLDSLHLPHGSILADTFSGCVPFIVVESKHPKQFVITNDRDFKPILADPVGFHARYLLVPNPTGNGSLDAINRTYPDIFRTGAGIARQVKEFNTPGCHVFRLFAVLPQQS